MTDRALSTVSNYVLVLGIVTILTSGLFIGTTGVLESQQERAVRSELDVVGHRLAADIATADRLVGQANGTGTVELTSELPRKVVGTTYKVAIVADGGSNRYEIRLRSLDPEMEVTVTFRTQTSVETSTDHRGTMRIVFDPDTSKLEVDHV